VHSIRDNLLSASRQLAKLRYCASLLNKWPLVIHR